MSKTTAGEEGRDGMDKQPDSDSTEATARALLAVLDMKESLGKTVLGKWLVNWANDIDGLKRRVAKLETQLQELRRNYMEHDHK